VRWFELVVPLEDGFVLILVNIGVVYHKEMQ